VVPIDSNMFGAFAGHIALASALSSCVMFSSSHNSCTVLKLYIFLFLLCSMYKLPEFSFEELFTALSPPDEPALTAITAPIILSATSTSTSASNTNTAQEVVVLDDSSPVVPLTSVDLIATSTNDSKPASAVVLADDVEIMDAKSDVIDHVNNSLNSSDCASASTADASSASFTLFPATTSTTTFFSSPASKKDGKEATNVSTHSQVKVAHLYTALLRALVRGEMSEEDESDEEDDSAPAAAERSKKRGK
jgi:hypothetical protein